MIGGIEEQCWCGLQVLETAAPWGSRVRSGIASGLVAPTNVNDSHVAWVAGVGNGSAVGLSVPILEAQRVLLL
jgi:hypothetical protein